MRGMRLRWGSVGSAVDATGETAGSLVDAILFFGYLFVWSLAMAAYIAMFILAGVVTSKREEGQVHHCTELTFQLD